MSDHPDSPEPARHETGATPARGDGTTVPAGAPATDRGASPAPSSAAAADAGAPPTRTGREIQRVPSWLASLTAWTWRLIVVVAGTAVLLAVLIRLGLVTLPIIIALVLATFLVPPARALEARGVPRGAAAAIVVLGSIAVFVGIIALLAPAFVEEVQALGPAVTAGIEDLFTYVERTFGYSETQVQDLIDQGIERISGSGGAIAGQLAAAGGALVQGLTALALAIVLLFFFVKDGEQIVAWIIARSPDAHRDTVRATGRRAWAALSGFVRGTALVAFVDAVGIGIGLAVLGIPLVLPIAVLTFFGGFIPVIGAAVAGFIAVLVALAATGDIIKALLVLGVVVLVQQLEANILQPMIMRRAVALHPVVILSALTAGGLLIGVIGAFLAVPTAAVLAAVGNELRLRHEARQRGEPVVNDPHPVGPEDEPVETDQL